MDGLTFSLTHVWRGEAVLRVSGGADPRVTDSDAFFRDRHPVLRPQALVPEAERTARAAEEWTREVMRRLEGEQFNVITLKWWGRPTQRAVVPRTARRGRCVRRRVGLPARARRVRRPRAGRRARDRRPRRRPAQAAGARACAARPRRDVRLRAPEDDGCRRTYEGPEGEAGDDRAARRGLLRAARRPRGRLRDRRPRDTGVTRRDPLGRSRAARRRRPGCARRRGERVRRDDLRPRASSDTFVAPT